MVFFAVVLKMCQNFLLKLSEQQILNELQLESFFQKVIEVDNDVRLDFNTLIAKFVSIN
jgi:hypothetical protein